MATDLNALVGSVLSGRYRLEKAIGEGGMGAVFEATQLSLGRRVAVKVVKPSLASAADAEDLTRRFERETEVIASLSHPHIVQVVDGGRADDGTLFLAMELLEGQSVRAVVRREGYVELGRALAIAEDVTSALVAAHAHGIIHRDLKAENVMLVRAAGKSELAKVLDFGVAKVTSRTEAPRETGGGVVPGTPGSIAPEQMLGKSDDPRSDLYSLGVMLFEMLTGEGPFTSPNAMELMLKHLTDPPPRVADVARGRGRPEVPVPVDDFVASLLAKDPEQRPASAQAAVDWIRTLRTSSMSTVPDLRLSIPTGATEVGSRLVALTPSSLPSARSGPSDIGPAAPSTQPTNAGMSPPRVPTASAPGRLKRLFLRAAIACVGLLSIVGLLWWHRCAADRFSSEETAEMELEQAAEALLALRLDEAEALIASARKRDPHGAPMGFALLAQVYLARERPLELVDATHATALRTVETKRALGLETDTHGFLRALNTIEDGRAVDLFLEHGGIGHCQRELLHTLLFAARFAMASFHNDEAERLLLKADPDIEHAFTAFSIARARVRRGKLKEAREMVDRHLVRLAPSSPQMEHLNAEILLAEGKPEEARARLARLSGGLDWRGRASYEYLGNRETRDWYVDIEKDMKRYLQDDPVLRSDLLVTLADALIAEGRIKEADRLLQAALQNDEITGARKVSLVALAQIFSMLVFDEQTARDWRNRSNADLLDGVEEDDPSVGRARGYSIAARILIQLAKSPNAKPDLRLLEKLRAGNPFLVGAVEWYVHVAQDEFPAAIKTASALPGCWASSYMASTYAKKWQQSKPASEEELAQGLAVLDKIATDEFRNACATGFHVYGFMQRIILVQALAGRAAVAAERNDLTRLQDSVARFDELWPYADPHLPAVQQIRDARSKLPAAAPRGEAPAVPSTGP